MTPDGVNPAAQGGQAQEEEQRPLERFGRDGTSVTIEVQSSPVSDTPLGV